MFQAQTKKKQHRFPELSIMSLIYVSTVRQLRRSHGNAIIGLAKAMMQGVIMIAVFYLMFEVLGMRGAAIQGADLMLYLMSGILLFMAHNQAINSVMGAENSTAQIMKHAPMTPFIALAAAALATLYTQVSTAITMLLFYHLAINPLEMEQPAEALLMLLLAWFSGCSIGLVLHAVKPWAPGFTNLVSMLYIRINMVASGKMVVANQLPGFMLAMFDWNPLFHCIDQVRGFVFLNYTPHNSSIDYPIYFSLSFIVLGFLGDFYTRQYASSSWSAKL